MANLSVKLGKLKLKNPVLVASGTFGYGKELKDLVSPSKLGAVVTKTITQLPRQGNSMPRTVETPSGLLNSIGLENQGIDQFLERKIPFLNKLSTQVIVSISGQCLKEFRYLVKVLDKQAAVDAIELNISCPNLEKPSGAGLIAQDAKAAYKLVKAVRRLTKKTLVTKLSPNVTDIVEIAQAVNDAGSDVLSLINTLYGMSINLNKRKPSLANIFGGLSGPAIKPVALYMVYRVASKVKLPIIGMGGIMNTQDALEFLLAGATAVAVGTANFVNPKAASEIIEGINKYLLCNKIKSVKQLTGALKA